MDANLQWLQTILQLGWPAIVMIECWLLWRDNLALRQKLIDTLERCAKIDPIPPPPTIHSGQD